MSRYRQMYSLRKADYKEDTPLISRCNYDQSAKEKRNSSSDHSDQMGAKLHKILMPFQEK